MTNGKLVDKCRSDEYTHWEPSCGVAVRDRSHLGLPVSRRFLKCLPLQNLLNEFQRLKVAVGAPHPDRCATCNVQQAKAETAAEMDFRAHQGYQNSLPLNLYDVALIEFR